MFLKLWPKAWAWLTAGVWPFKPLQSNLFIDTLQMSPGIRVKLQTLCCFHPVSRLFFNSSPKACTDFTVRHFWGQTGMPYPGGHVTSRRRGKKAGKSSWGRPVWRHAGKKQMNVWHLGHSGSSQKALILYKQAVPRFTRMSGWHGGGPLHTHCASHQIRDLVRWMTEIFQW